MRSMVHGVLIAAAAALVLGGCAMVDKWFAPGMSFFITSTNPGKGADFGGLAGADQHCQRLAGAVGAGHRTWRAYLSTTAAGGAPAVDARDRIGKGPWHNVKGDRIAGSLDELHGANQLNKQTGLTEKGEQLRGSGEPGNVHDILTGSTPEGRASRAAEDTTCGNWTSSTTGSAIVGHFDRVSTFPGEAGKSWSTAHGSRGCSPDGLKSTGGGGLLYCFAAN